MSPSFYISRGNARARRGEYDLAIADFTKALELNSNEVDALIGRGSAHANKGEHEQAIADFTKVLELNPNNAAARFNRGICHSKMGENTLATTDFSQAVAINPELEKKLDKRHSEYRMSQIHAELEKMDERIKERESTRNACLCTAKWLSGLLYAGTFGTVLLFMLCIECGAILPSLCKTDGMDFYQLMPIAFLATLVLAPFYWHLVVAQIELGSEKNKRDKFEVALRAKIFGLPLAMGEPQQPPGVLDAFSHFHALMDGKGGFPPP